MPADSIVEQNPIERQALEAIQHLADDDKHKVLEYIRSLLHLAEVKND